MHSDSLFPSQWQSVPTCALWLLLLPCSCPIDLRAKSLLDILPFSLQTLFPSHFRIRRSLHTSFQQVITQCDYPSSDIAFPRRMLPLQQSLLIYSASPCHPDLYRVIRTNTAKEVTASRGDACAIGRPRHRIHSTRMPTIGEDVTSTNGIPHLHGVISSRNLAASRGDACAIGRPRHRIHSTRMPSIDEEVATISGSPHLHRVIIAPRGDALAIGRPRHRIHSTRRDTRMPIIVEDGA